MCEEGFAQAISLSAKLDFDLLVGNMVWCYVAYLWVQMIHNGVILDFKGSLNEV